MFVCRDKYNIVTKVTNIYYLFCSFLDIILYNQSIARNMNYVLPMYCPETQFIFEFRR